MKYNTPLMQVHSLRLIGVLYLFVILFAGFSQGYVRGTLVVANDATTTATNILLHEGLFRLGLTTDLLAFILDSIISVLLYQLFKPFNKTLAMVSAALRLVAHPAIASLNLLNHYMAYEVLGDAIFLSSFDEAQVQSISLLFMEAHRYGYLIAGAFFGIHCFLLGILIYQSSIVPKLFGGFLLGSAVGYLVETFINFNLPGHEGSTALLVGITAAIGEVGLTFYLLIKGATKAYKKALQSDFSSKNAMIDKKYQFQN
ncbi:MAG: DUF4386 domain-containing protein [Bacteroidota bacterium]